MGRSTASPLDVRLDFRHFRPGESRDSCGFRLGRWCGVTQSGEKKTRVHPVRGGERALGQTQDVYSSVRIKEGNSGLFTAAKQPRAFTHGNTIYIPPDDLPLTDDLLVHEMAHVWQHQNGGTDYMSEALWAQNVGDGYNFKKGIDEGKSWSELNPEQQAQLLQQAQLSGFFNPPPGKRFEFKGTDYTDYLLVALKQVRAGKGAP